MVSVHEVGKFKTSTTFYDAGHRAEPIWEKHAIPQVFVRVRMAAPLDVEVAAA
jgi:hypothetical protein